MYLFIPSPPLEGTNGRSTLLSSNMTLTGLRPATEYRVELFAVLTTGAETDLVESVFTTSGQQVTVSQSLCALSYAALESTETVASECDFEGLFNLVVNVKLIENIRWNNVRLVPRSSIDEELQLAH